MITIHKFPLKRSELFTVQMPEGAEVIHVAMQYGDPCMWARVDTSKPLRSFVFGLFGTGHDMKNTGTGLNAGDYENPMHNAPHVATFFYDTDGCVVFHLFGGNEG